MIRKPLTDMKTKSLLSLLLLPALLLVACSDDEGGQAPASFEAKNISYFFEGDDGVKTYEVVADTFEYYNDSDVEKWVDWIPVQSDNMEYSFTVTIPDTFDWLAEGDTLWVDDIDLRNNAPTASLGSLVPYRPGTTRWPDGSHISLRISVPPHMAVIGYYTECFQEITSSYLLELENTATGEPLLAKGKMKKKWVYNSVVDFDDKAEVKAVGGNVNLRPSLQMR